MFFIFLWVKGFNAKDIHKEIFPVSGGKCLLCKVAHNWVEKCSQGCSKVADDARPGHPVEIVTEAMCSGKTVKRHLCGGF
jgi:hypothetical protein